MTPVPSASAWTPLRQPLFRSFWVATVASNIGTWMHGTAATWMMTTLSDSPMMVAAMQTATTLPFFVFALPAGALADVLDRRRVLLVAQAWMLVVACVLGYLAIERHLDPWALLGLTCLLSVGAVLAAPAQQAITPDLIDKDQLPQALALNGVAINCARAVGPAAGGLLVAALGFGAVFFVNALSFLGLMLILFRWRAPAVSSTLPPEQVASAMRAGARYALHSTPFRTVLIRSAAFVFPGTALWTLLPIVAQGPLQLQAVGYGALLGCLGIGAILGAAVLPQLRTRLTIQALLAGATILFALVTWIVSLTHSLPLVALALVPAGAAWMAGMSTLNFAAQATVPAWVRARGLAISLLVAQGSMALGGLGWGLGAERFGVTTALAAAAFALPLCLLVVWRFDLDPIAALDLEPSHDWATPARVGMEEDEGPVLVTVAYSVAAADAAAFVAAMQELRVVRRRDGALRWALYRDAAQPHHYLETFTVASWSEHLRQHQRVTVADRELEGRVRRLHSGPQPPKVDHFIATNPQP